MDTGPLVNPGSHPAKINLRTLSKIYGTLIFYGLIDPNNKEKGRLVRQGPCYFNKKKRSNSIITTATIGSSRSDIYNIMYCS
jgi:hypothetical protein